MATTQGTKYQSVYWDTAKSHKLYEMINQKAPIKPEGLGSFIDKAVYNQYTTPLDIHPVEVQASQPIDNTLTYGMDTEYIVRDIKTNTPVSIVGLIGGSKSNPTKVSGGAIQEDNVLLEINIDPAKTAFEFVNNTQKVLKYASNLVSKHGLYLDTKCSVAKYPKEELYSPQAWMSGCEPFYNAWTGDEVKAPEWQSNLRCAGGHLHIGISNINKEPPRSRMSLIKMLDQVIGIPLVFLHPNPFRAKIYGMAGSYRPKPYGVEYRVPDNWWIDKPERILAILNIVELSYQYITNNNYQPAGIFNTAATRNTINKQSTTHAKKLYMSNYRLDNRYKSIFYNSIRRHSSNKIRSILR